MKKTQQKNNVENPDVYDVAISVTSDEEIVGSIKMQKAFRDSQIDVLLGQLESVTHHDFDGEK
jgi:hypothetical protein